MTTVVKRESTVPIVMDIVISVVNQDMLRKNVQGECANKQRKWVYSIHAIQYSPLQEEVATLGQEEEEEELKFMTTLSKE